MAPPLKSDRGFFSMQQASTLAHNNDIESLESKAIKALACPCVSELREGPCGKEFSKAFICFYKSSAPAKGSDCVQSFVAMQECMSAKSDQFIKPEDGQISVHTSSDQPH